MGLKIRSGFYAYYHEVENSPGSVTELRVCGDIKR